MTLHRLDRIIFFLHKAGIKSFLASYFCHLLIMFVNSFDPDKDPQNVCPDLDSNIQHSDSVHVRIF